jgi:ketosteroid isomerase-like protein
MTRASPLLSLATEAEPPVTCSRDTARAMSQENVEIARQAAETIDWRDRTAWLALHDEECEVVAMDDWPEPGVRGAEAAWDFYGTVFDALDRIGRSGIGDVELVDAGGDKVLVHLRNDLSGGESGAAVQFNYWVAVTIQQGRIVREHWFADRADALEAAGLRE